MSGRLYRETEYRVRRAHGTSLRDWVLNRLAADPDLTISDVARTLDVDPQRLYYWLGSWGWRTGRGPRLVRTGADG